MLDTLEAGDELERHESFLVSLDMLQQELVLGDVGIREVELNLAKKIVSNVQNTVFVKLNFPTMFHITMINDNCFISTDRNSNKV